MPQKALTKQKPDYILLFTIFALIGIGFLALSSASAVLSKEKFNTPYYYLKHQLIYGLIIGIILGLLAYKINLKFFEKFSLLAIILTFFFIDFGFPPKIWLCSWRSSTLDYSWASFFTAC